MSKEKNNGTQKILTIIGIILCAVLLPVLIINSTLLLKSFTNKNEVPSFFGHMPMIILSDSMNPEMKSGDLIFCRKVAPEEVKVGDVISFYDPEGNGVSVVTHRVVEITEQDGQLAFRTKGDNNNTEDLSLVPADKLVARYTGICLSGFGNVAMFMQTSKGLVVCVVIPLLLFVGYDLLRRRSYEKKQKADTEALREELELLRAQKEVRMEAVETDTATESREDVTSAVNAERGESEDTQG